MRWTYFIEKYRTVTNVVGTILVSWILSAAMAQLIGLFLPENQTSAAAAVPRSVSIQDDIFSQAEQKMLKYYQPICDRNLFDSLKRAQCEEEIPENGEAITVLDLNSAPVKSDLAATLLGTMVSTNPNRSFATIAPKGGKEAEPYYIDQMVMGEAKVYDVQRNKVFFIRNGHREFLEVENLPNIFSVPNDSQQPSTSPGGTVKWNGDKATVARAKVDATLGDLNNIVQQARMVPDMKNGQVEGFRVFAIRPGSIFQELGLQNGDVIQRINGNEINSVEKAIPMLQMARSESLITIDLVRGGAKKTLTIEIQ